MSNNGGWGTGKPRHRWTEEESKAVETYYPLFGGTWSGWPRVLPDLTLAQIRAKAATLGIRMGDAARRKAALRTWETRRAQAEGAA